MTEKKIKILELLTKGFSHKQIAYELGKSLKTISNHVYEMFIITNIKNIVQLVVFGIKNNYVEI